MSTIEKKLALIRRTPRVNGYTAPGTETRKSGIHGLGLFASEAIPKGTVVAMWGGHALNRAEVEALPSDISHHYALEIYPDLYLVEMSHDELDASDFINHSCAPNCDIANRLVMVTNRAVKKGEELTADFTCEKNGRKTRCKCGAGTCRKLVHF